MSQELFLSAEPKGNEVAGASEREGWTRAGAGKWWVYPDLAWGSPASWQALLGGLAMQLLIITSPR